MKVQPMLSTSISLTLLVLLYSPLRAQSNWPQFRGPGAAGVAENENLPDTENVSWKTEIPGRGWSSPIV